MRLFRRRLVLLVLLVLLGLTLLGGFDRTRTKGSAARGDYVAGELLVKVRDEATLSKLLNRETGVEKIREVAGSGWTLLRLPQGLAAATAIERFRSLVGVEAVQPNFIYRTQASVNDPRFSDLYGLGKIQAPQAWDRTTGIRDVVVAVIDLGIDYNHEDLSANMWRNPGETGTDASGRDKASNGVDDDENGYKDDVFGIDAINRDSDPMDDSGHGTHVAGTIGAVGNNAKGVVGVNWTVSLMALKTHDASGNGTSASVVEAFRYAALMRRRGVNVRVTNSSWGGAPEAPAYDQALKDAIDEAGAAGILNVCAAGNGNNNNDLGPFYPATYDSPSIVSVAASDQNDNRAGFSSYGATTVDLAAPGVSILSTLPATYGRLSGTSMATPHVAGAAALLCAYNPYLSLSELKTTILSSVDVLPNWSNLTLSGGRLNLARALQSIPVTNQIDTAEFFVRQHYLDFLNREPDPGGLGFWSNEINLCNSEPGCIRSRRIDVSAAFFIESEFQQTGSFVIRVYRASHGRRPNFVEFSGDRGMVVAGPNIEQSQRAFATQWVTREAFTLVYPLSLTPEEFVHKLFDTAQLFPFTAERQQQIDSMRNEGKGRAEVVRSVIELQEFKAREYNPSFVLMQYFGYLRREPDEAGLLFWLDVLNNREPNNFRSMVCAFITSPEYQLRFAPVVSRTNAECGQ